MGSNYHSTSTSGVPTSRANKKATSKATPPLPPSIGACGPPLGPGQHAPPGPAPPFTEHDRATVNNGPSFRDSNSLHPEGPKEPSSRQVCGPHVVDDSAGRGVVSLIPGTFPFRCKTIARISELNCQINGEYVCRWQPSSIPIPIGINFSSFESRAQGEMVKRCLTRVLDSLNSKIIGIQFRTVDDTSDSAFYVSFGGDSPDCYAESFFPGSHPKDWHIYVYKLGLSLSKEQKQLLSDTITSKSRDIKVARAAARLEALEQNLSAILSHEMLHIMGLRHCDAQQTEKGKPCGQYPSRISPKDHHDPLMQTYLDWSDFSELDWNSKTMKHIRKIYTKKDDGKIFAKTDDGEIVGYKIKNVSWEAGAKERDDLLKMHYRRVCKARKARKAE